jgi:hypothetical protein
MRRQYKYLQYQYKQHLKTNGRVTQRQASFQNHLNNQPTIIMSAHQYYKEKKNRE